MEQRWRSLAALTIARAAMGFQFQTVAALAPLLQRDLALDKAQLGWLIGLYLLPGAAVALPGGLLGKRFGDRRVVVAGLALMAVGGVGLAAAQWFAQANVARLVSGVGAVVLNVLVTKMVADAFEGKERLLAMSILINSWPIGIGLALLVAGPLGAHVGWPWGFASSALFALIGCALVAGLHRAPRAAAAGGAPARATLSRREWRSLVVASLPWLLYNAAFQIVLSFLPSLLVERGIGIAAAGSLVAVTTAMFVVSVQAGGVVLRRARHSDRICHLVDRRVVRDDRLPCRRRRSTAVARRRRPDRRSARRRVRRVACRALAARGAQPRHGHLLHDLLPRLRVAAGARRTPVRPRRRRRSDGLRRCARALVRADPLELSPHDVARARRCARAGALTARRV